MENNFGLTTDNWVSIHNHTAYSVLDGMCKIDELVARAKEIGMTALAITDHNHLGGTIEFQKACNKQGVKPLLGYEGYYTQDTSIASLPPEDRNRMAVFNAIKAGDIPADEYADIAPMLEFENWEETKEAVPDKAIEKICKKKKGGQETAITAAVKKHSCDMHQYHILYVAKNQTGWKNLIALQSESARLCTFNGRFLADMDLIRKYHEGILCTTACIGSYSSKKIQEGKIDEAEEYIKDLHDIFGDDLYLEVQPLNNWQQNLTNQYYYIWAAQYGIKTLATTDVHYVNKSDWDDHDTYMCISTGKLKTDTDRMKYTNDFWLHTVDEVVEGFDTQTRSLNVPDDQKQAYMDWCISSIKNTQEFADKVDDILIGSKTPLYPQFQLPKGISDDDLLRIRAYKGLYDYFKKMDEEGEEYDRQAYEDELFEEMEVITAKHYSSYFLMVQEYVNWGNSINPETGYPYCSVGPGRGSADGSLVLFCIGVSLIDPVKNNLMFSRFLNMNRNSPPDIDCDFNWAHRPDLIHHLEEKYGKPKVAHIGTWTKESVLTGIKDFARVLNVPFEESNTITTELGKLVDKPQAKFKDYDEMEEYNPDGFKKYKEYESKYPEIFRLARRFEGCCRQFGTHASGVLVTPVNVTDVVPTRKDPKTGDVVTLYTGVELEEAGCIKFDVLGLKNLTIIENTIKYIKDEDGNSMSFEDLYRVADITDKNVYDMICRGETDGVFQIESNMFKGLISSIQPSNFGDISALVAIGRPGPLSAGCGDRYAAWKHDRSLIEPYLRGVDDILEDTYGNIIYQEQLMLIGMRAFGFNQGQSDSIIRKIFAKKKADQLEKLRRIMIYGMVPGKGPEGWENNSTAPWYDEDGHYGDAICGGVANGYTAEEVQNFFDSVKGFASYSFNRSHSAAYGYISFLTAWLKCYYPAQYMAALLSMQDTDEDKDHYIKTCREMGINIKVPNVNHSKEGFLAEDSETILYGLGSIKGVGVAKVQEIIKNAPYDSIEDAISRLPKQIFNKTVGESLIRAGAFDGIDGENRNEMLNTFHQIRKDKQKDEKNHVIKGADGKALLIYDDPEAYCREVCMAMETLTLGSSVTYVSKWNDIESGSTVKEQCEILEVRPYTTKSSKKSMGYLTVKYDGDKVKATIFPKAWERLASAAIVGKSVWILGKKDDKGELIVDDIKDNENDLVAPARRGKGKKAEKKPTNDFADIFFTLPA